MSINCYTFFNGELNWHTNEQVPWPGVKSAERSTDAISDNTAAQSQKALSASFTSEKIFLALQHSVKLFTFRPTFTNVELFCMNHKEQMCFFQLEIMYTRDTQTSSWYKIAKCF